MCASMDGTWKTGTLNETEWDNKTGICEHPDHKVNRSFSGFYNIG